jgi:GAF domain-containing protein
MASLNDRALSAVDGRPSSKNSTEPPTVTCPSVDPTTAYTELAKIVLGEQPLGAVLRRIARLAQQTVPGADEVSVTLIERGRARTVAFSGQLAAALDERQYEDGFGPCMDAALTGQTITVEDTRTDQHYPGFARQARRQGIRHTLSLGMVTMYEITGALNIYGRGEAGPFEQRALDIAAGYAAYASVALVNAATYAGAMEQVSQMQQAMTSRAVIEQAKGILMAGRRCGADEAFGILRDLSSSSNRKLRDVAQAVVEDVLR